jgi:uncharacterized protein (UPF0276 family)
MVVGRRAGHPVVRHAVAEDAEAGVEAAEASRMTKDRVGISWRSELAAGILTSLDRIDVVEVIADDYFRLPANQVKALRTLAAQVPVTLHGISQGLASTVQADPRRLERMAKVAGLVEPESWSEHLAFVRGGEVEIGHLAATPRNSSTVDGTCANLHLARRIVGAAPMIENIATLIDPPGSALSEAEWIAQIIAGSDCDLLLDLHNLHANALNFGYDPVRFLNQIPCARVSTVHLAGGKWVGRLLDDHLHDVPDPVYHLLTELAARVPGTLTVILERDGAYPPFEHLLRQLDRAREALVAGRQRRAA